MVMKMDSELISVIVPVYNVEQYIRKCIDSVIEQSYRNIEIILVNDGSTDSSGVICDEYQNQDERIRVIHKANGGLSEARNVGIDAAYGKYITFVDSDDVIQRNMIKSLYELLVLNECDISICDVVHCYSYDDIRFIESGKKHVYPSQKAIEEMFYQKSFLVAACGKLYKSSMFDSIRFPYGMLFEDSAIMYKVFDCADSIVYSESKLYGYMHRVGSITTREFSKKDCDILIICKQIIKYMDNRCRSLRFSSLVYYVNACLRIYLNAPRNGHFDSYIAECKMVIKKNAVRCIFSNRIRNKLRVALVLFLVNKKLLFRLYKRTNRWS